MDKFDDRAAGQSTREKLDDGEKESRLVLYMTAARGGGGVQNKYSSEVHRFGGARLYGRGVESHAATTATTALLQRRPHQSSLCVVKQGN